MKLVVVTLVLLPKTSRLPQSCPSLMTRKSSNASSWTCSQTR